MSHGGSRRVHAGKRGSKAAAEHRTAEGGDAQVDVLRVPSRDASSNDA